MNAEELKDEWWGDYEIPLNCAARWTIGPSVVEISRSSKEWRVGSASLPSAAEGFSVSLALPSGGELARSKGERYCFSSTTEHLRVMPGLADRSVVTRPIAPFYVYSDQEATIFASTPLWMTVYVHMPPVKISDFAILRPSDTWFGASPMDGELCYASRTNCFLSPSEVPRRPHRAITPVTIVNRSKRALLLDRVNIPVRHLSLFANDDGTLWTEEIVLGRKETEQEVEMKMQEGPPAWAARAVRVTGPRERLDRNIVARALETLFG